MLRAAGLLGSAVLGLTLTGCTLFQPAGATGKRIPLAFYLAGDQARSGFRELKNEQGGPLYVAAEPILTEKDVRGAAVLNERGAPTGKQPRGILLLEFETFAAARLQRETSDNVGQRLAVFLDDQFLLSYPIIAPFTHPKVYLDGGFTPARAADIVRRLQVPATAPDDMDAPPAAAGRAPVPTPPLKPGAPPPTRK